VVRCSSCLVLGAASLFAASTPTAAQTPGVSLSPFVTFLPTGSATPSAGLSMTVSGGPIALRAGGHLSLEERNSLPGVSSPMVMRPWGADADALAFLESYSYGGKIAFTPYALIGVSTSVVDTAARRFDRQGWSYGGGLTMPMGKAVGLFGETRWRISEFVLPSADHAPPATREFRVGLSFRVGGGGDMTQLLQVMSAAAGGDVAADDPATSNKRIARLIAAASEYVGTPYHRGGTSPLAGFDASGFVRFVFERFGVTLPRVSRDQARVGERVRPDWTAIEPGDLVMFSDEGGINHVAIYVGHAKIIHSSETGGGVRYDDLTTDRGRWFASHLAAARRIAVDANGSVDLARGFPSNVPGNADGPDHAPRPRKKN
jgi:cell wall-associated NlpC family hydrolase